MEGWRKLGKSGEAGGELMTMGGGKVEGRARPKKIEEMGIFLECGWNLHKLKAPAWRASCQESSGVVGMSRAGLDGELCRRCQEKTGGLVCRTFIPFRQKKLKHELFEERIFFFLKRLEWLVQRGIQKLAPAMRSHWTLDEAKLNK